jgi:hypothetical protein
MVPLYHGTSADIAERAKTEGLLPRLDGKGNWPDKLSRTECVYLTSAFAGIYAPSAQPRTGDLAIVEVDLARLDPSRLLPDEDFLGQCVSMRDSYPLTLRVQKKKKQVHQQRMRMITRDLELYAGADWLSHLKRRCGAVWEGASQWESMVGWKASLTGLGTCAHKGTISPTAITRVVCFPRGPHPVLTPFCTPEVTIEDHLRHQAELAKCNRLLFEGYDPNDWPDEPQYRNRDGFRVSVAPW